MFNDPLPDEVDFPLDEPLLDEPALTDSYLLDLGTFILQELFEDGEVI